MKDFETNMKAIGYSLANIDLTSVMDAIETNTIEEKLLMLKILSGMTEKHDYRDSTSYSVNQTDTNYDEKNRTS